METAPIELTPEQKYFLARACAFIRTNPAQGDLDKLITLATMLLPEPVVDILRRCAAASDRWDDPRLTRWLQ